MKFVIILLLATTAGTFSSVKKYEKMCFFYQVWLSYGKEIWHNVEVIIFFKKQCNSELLSTLHTHVFTKIYVSWDLNSFWILEDTFYNERNCIYLLWKFFTGEMMLITMYFYSRLYRHVSNTTVIDHDCYSIFIK